MGIAQIYNSINELIGEPHRIELIDPRSIKEKLFGEDHDCKSGCPCGMGNDDDVEPEISEDEYEEYKNNEINILNSMR